MTAKEYLEQAIKLDDKINARLQELERLRALSTVITPPKLTHDRVQTSGTADTVGDIVAKIVDLEAVINSEIDELVALKAEIRERINAVPDDTLRLILHKRYINLQKWDRIAEDMNYSYKHVFKLYKQAIKKVDTK